MPSPAAVRCLTPIVFAVAASAQGQIKIALCGAASGTNTACQWTTPQAALMATGLFSTVDIVNCSASTPTIQQLGQYDALLAYTNTTPLNNVAWGDVMADYVDQGGGVVVAVFANSTTTAGRNIAGRWQTGYEVVLDQSGNASGAGATLGTVSQPAHPVMAGVTTFTGGTIGSRPVGTTLEVGSTLIAQWSDGKVLVAEGSRSNRIDLGFYPPIATCSQSGWATGGDLLMANALRYVARTAAYHPYGAGCAGTAGVPLLAAAGNSRPVVNTLFQAQVDNLPFGFGAMVLGFSNTSSGGVPLPADLGVLNMPGCSLLAELGQIDLITGSGTSATWFAFVPNDPTLIGVNFFNQAASYDPAANGFGWTASNGCRGRVGV